eukprot:1160410-Pelagomonas_calceolata.AAC.6
MTSTQHKHQAQAAGTLKSGKKCDLISFFPSLKEKKERLHQLKEAACMKEKPYRISILSVMLVLQAGQRHLRRA